MNTEGVLERFQNNSEKVYLTTLSKCNCTFATEYQAPCKHVIFLRSNDEETYIFDANLFNWRYQRTVSSNTRKSEREVDSDAPSASNVNEDLSSDIEDFDDSDDFRVLSDLDAHEQQRGEQQGCRHNLADEVDFLEGHSLPSACTSFGSAGGTAVSKRTLSIEPERS